MLGEIAADDELIRRLGSGGFPPSGDHAVNLLATWRADCCADPLPDMSGVLEVYLVAVATPAAGLPAVEGPQ